MNGESRYFINESITEEKLRNLLDVRSHNSLSGLNDRIDAMKYLLAMTSKGLDVSSSFPDVVKNVMIKNIECKKLVYTYLMMYADHNQKCRELALLSVNNFQKDLADPNPLIRGLALRTMTSIRVPEIIELQILATKKCSTDTSFYVRKCSAHAIAKILPLIENKDQCSQLIDEVLKKLLGDSSPIVVSSAIAVLHEVSPSRYDLIHPIFRKLCRTLAELDEWGQMSLLPILVRYCRTFFLNPIVESTSQSTSLTSISISSLSSSSLLNKDPFANEKKEYSNKRKVASSKQDLDAFLMDDGKTNTPILIQAPTPKPSFPTNTQINDSSSLSNTFDFKTGLHPDHKLLLQAVIPLLHSRNSGVVLSAASLLWYCGQRSEGALQKVAQALVRQLHSSREIQYVCLNAILPLARENSRPFRPFLNDFFIDTVDDASYIRMLKLDILICLCASSEEHEHARKSDPFRSTDIEALNRARILLKELEQYVRLSDRDFSAASVRAVGRIASCFPELAEGCLFGLVDLVGLGEEDDIIGDGDNSFQPQYHQEVRSEAIIIIRTLLQQHPGEYPEIVRKLLKSLFHQNLKNAETKKDEKNVLLLDMDSDSNAVARASIVWIASEFCADAPELLPDLLRKFAQHFPKEPYQVKLQILNFVSHVAIKKNDLLNKINAFYIEKEDAAAKGDSDEDSDASEKNNNITNSESNEKKKKKPPSAARIKKKVDKVPGKIEKITSYIFELASFDNNCDVRDRARFLQALISLPSSKGKDLMTDDYSKPISYPDINDSERVILAPKQMPENRSFDSIIAKDPVGKFSLHSLSHVVGHTTQGYEPIPDWPTVQPSPSIRDEAEQGLINERRELESNYGNSARVEHDYSSSSEEEDEDESEEESEEERSEEGSDDDEDESDNEEDDDDNEEDEDEGSDDSSSDSNSS